MTFYGNIENQHGREARNLMRNYHKQVKKISRIKNNIQFLIKCRRSKVIPNFIYNKTKNILSLSNIHHNKLKNTVHQTNQKILNLSIREKFENLNILEKHLSITTNKINFLIPSNETKQFFRAQMDSQKIFRKTLKNKTDAKLNRILQQENLNLNVDQNWFQNLSNTIIPTDIQNILALGPKFTVDYTRKSFPIHNTITDCENIIKNLNSQIKIEQQSEIRNRMVQILSTHMNKIDSYISPQQSYIQTLFYKTKKFLKQHKNDIIIIEADKGNISAAMNKSEYTGKMESILADNNRFRHLARDPTLRLERQNNAIVKSLFDKSYIDEIKKKILTTYTSNAPRCYAMIKLHKPDRPLRVVIPNIGNPNRNISKFINNICSSIQPTINYNIKNSFELIEKLKHIDIDDNDIMVSFDVISMYEKIPLPLVYKAITQRWPIIKTKTSIGIATFLQVVKFCIDDSNYFKFDGKFYSQRTGLAIGGCASTILADFVLTDIIQEAKRKLNFEPKLLVKYVDDILMIIPKEQFEKTYNTFNSINNNIQFTHEIEQDNRIPYLDVMLIRNNHKIQTQFYQKPTNLGRLLNFLSSHPKHQKLNTAQNLVHRIFNLTSNEYWPDSIKTAQLLLSKNNYPSYIINSIIDKKINHLASVNINNQQINNPQPPKYISTNYNYKFSENIQRLVTKYDPQIKLSQKTTQNIKSIQTSLKDKIPPQEKHNLIYQINCNNCNKVYIGQTGQIFKKRINQHSYDQKNKHIFTDNSTALQIHALNTGHSFNFKEPKILATENNYRKRTILEMIHIKTTKNTVNKKSDTDNLHSIYATILRTNNS